MGKIKRLVSLGLMLLLSALLCLTAFGCGKKSTNNGDLVPSDEDGAYGLYTNLALSLDGGDGQVWATVKNTFTLFPSAVTVKVELYSSDDYSDDCADMTLATENYIADLNYGKSITATSSTGGVTKYWKAKMSYRIDKDGWREKVTNTLLLDKDGIVTNVKVEWNGERELYILKQAYEFGWLSTDDIKSIACGYYEMGNRENPYSGLYKEPTEQLTEEIETEIKQAFCRWLRISETLFDSVVIIKYYGIYNGNAVLSLKCTHVFEEPIFFENYNVAGVIFKWFWPEAILVYHI